MKKSLLLAIIIFSLIAKGNAQLANTKWTGTANLLQPDNSLVTANISWDFGKDTVFVFIGSVGEPEVLRYTLNKDIMSMTKISGGSPCDPGTDGKLKFQITDDKLFLTVLETKCEAFSKALDGKPFIKVK